MRGKLAFKKTQSYGHISSKMKCIIACIISGSGKGEVRTENSFDLVTKNIAL